MMPSLSPCRSTGMLPFWWNFHHMLQQKFSKWRRKYRQNDIFVSERIVFNSPCINQTYNNQKLTHLSVIPQCTIQNRNMHISVLNGALWDVAQVHCGICAIGLLTRLSFHTDDHEHLQSGDKAVSHMGGLIDPQREMLWGIPPSNTHHESWWVTESGESYGMPVRSQRLYFPWF